MSLITFCNFILVSGIGGFTCIFVLTLNKFPHLIGSLRTLSNDQIFILSYISHERFILLSPNITLCFNYNVSCFCFEFLTLKNEAMKKKGQCSWSLKYFILLKIYLWCFSQIHCPEGAKDSANVQAQNSIVMVTEYYGKLPAFSNSSAGGTAKLFDGLWKQEKNYY